MAHRLQPLSRIYIRNATLLPHVPFTARGAYRKRYPPVDPQLVLEEELAGTSSYHSRREANRRSLWNKVAWESCGKPLSGLTDARPAQIPAQADGFADGTGYRTTPEREGSGFTFVNGAGRKLPSPIGSTRSGHSWASSSYVTIPRRAFPGRKQTRIVNGPAGNCRRRLGEMTDSFSPVGATHDNQHVTG